MTTFRQLLLQGCEAQRLPSTAAEAVEELFGQVCQCLDQRISDHSTEASGSNSSNASSFSYSSHPALLYSLLLLLSLCPAFWTSTEVKSKLPALIASTLMQKRLHSLASSPKLAARGRTSACICTMCWLVWRR